MVDIGMRNLPPKNGHVKLSHVWSLVEDIAQPGWDRNKIDRLKDVLLLSEVKAF